MAGRCRIFIRKLYLCREIIDCMRISIKRLMTIVSCLFVTVMVSWAADVPRVTWDGTSLIIDGRRVCPVMGEIHYIRASRRANGGRRCAK